MIPGEMWVASGEIELNAGRERIALSVANTGDRPVQVGSHYHFFETNAALAFGESFPVGLIATTLSAAILRKKRTAPGN